MPLNREIMLASPFVVFWRYRDDSIHWVRLQTLGGPAGMPSYKSVARHTGSSSASVLNILNNFNVMTMQRDRHSAKSALPRLPE